MSLFKELNKGGTVLIERTVNTVDGALSLIDNSINLAADLLKEERYATIDRIGNLKVQLALNNIERVAKLVAAGYTVEEAKEILSDIVIK